MPHSHFDVFTCYIRSFDQDHILKSDREKPLHFNVWQITSSHVSEMIKNGNTDHIPADNASPDILHKLNFILRRISEAEIKADNFMEQIIFNDRNIELCIALHEIVKGTRSGVTRQKEIYTRAGKVWQINKDSKTLAFGPWAEEIGCKIMYKSGYTFRAPKEESNFVHDSNIRKLYRQAANHDLLQLESMGYINLHGSHYPHQTDTHTEPSEKVQELLKLLEPTPEEDLKELGIDADSPEAWYYSSKDKSDGIERISLNEKSLGVRPGSAETRYFDEECDEDLSGTELGTIIDILNAVYLVTQRVEPDKFDHLPSETLTIHFKHELDNNKRSDDTNGITKKIKKGITEIEHRTDLTDDQKVSQITHIACATCAGIAVQPIPFADIFILTPIQGYFGTRIAAIRGVPVSENEANDQIKEIVGIIGMGFIAQQMAIAIWKTVTGGFGGLLTIPLVYALSYAVMSVIDAYYSAKAKKQKLSDDQIKDIWENAFREGKKKGKKNQNENRTQ